MRIAIKALSVNQCWQGHRYKTKDYLAYERELMVLLPKLTIRTDCNLCIAIEIGYSNKLADIDNFLKPFLDILQKKYQINDNKIYKLYVEKVDTKKKEEFIAFEISPL